MFNEKGGGGPNPFLTMLKKNCTFLIRWLPLFTAYSIFVHFHCHCYLHLFAIDFHFLNIDEFSLQLTSTKRSQSQAQRSQDGLSIQSLSNMGRWFIVEVSFCSIFSSVRSSYSHPDLLVIQQHHPLFQFAPVLEKVIKTFTF